jgi:rhamnogalacturonan hydrolase
MISDVTADTAAAVSNITMRNIYIYQCTQMLMIKTFPGGTGATGYVTNSVFENFWAYDTTYGLGKHSSSSLSKSVLIYI